MQNAIFFNKNVKELYEIAGREYSECQTLYELVSFVATQRDNWDSTDFLGLLRITAENKSADEKVLDFICDIALSEVEQHRHGLNYSCLQMVFRNVASNLNTGSVTFKKLLDNKCRIREFIAENPSLSDELLLYMVENTNNRDVLAISAKQLAARYKAVLEKTGK